MAPVARYDGLAEWYDQEIHSGRAGSVTTLATATLGRLLGAGPGRCLDVGCGTGAAVRTLAGLGWTVVGVDLSADQLRVARDNAGEVAERLIQADAAALPFAAETFDAVVSMLTHTDLDEPAATFAEAARVLRPGGRLVHVGTHPCFTGPAVERRADGPHLLHAGYRRRGWWTDAPGFRLGREGIRGRVGVNHLPLADLLDAIVDAGLRIERVEEPEDEDYPLLLALAATK